MRNLAAHPVTKEEEVKVLRELADELQAEKRFGDSRPEVLRTIADRIQATPG